MKGLIGTTVLVLISGFSAYASVHDLLGMGAWFWVLSFVSGSISIFIYPIIETRNA